MKRRNKQKLSIFSNVLHLLYGTAASAILQAIALFLLASYLQAHDFGVFSVALAMAMIMGYFTDAGLGDLVLREGSKKSSRHSNADRLLRKNKVAVPCAHL
ncbi:oligosaccharide flippase family protein [Geomicrobium sp. JCM 19055]|uniref:oligosaccharide flippase family protein n=1 Tax=Geomicrobium sp. JCM 19055 TaxID=1460649 RepID=UPI001268BCD5